MKKKFLSVLLLIAPIVTFAQEKGLDQKIDEAFGNVTGWFVEFIFYQKFWNSWCCFSNIYFCVNFQYYKNAICLQKNEFSTF